MAVFLLLSFHELFIEASGRLPEAPGRFPDASGRFPEASGNFPKLFLQLPGPGSACAWGGSSKRSVPAPVRPRRRLPAAAAAIPAAVVAELVMGANPEA